MDTESPDVVVIGAGPYGLSVGAHLSAAGVRTTVLGRSMATWQENMPTGMFLKSEGFASNLSDPSRRLTLAHFCRAHGLPYGDYGYPVALETFVAYAKHFQWATGVTVNEERVTAVKRAPAGSGYVVHLEGRDPIAAPMVVVAVGLTYFAHLPRELSALGPGLVSHPRDHRSVEGFRGQRVAIVGAGQSALESAALIREHGGDPIVLVRKDGVSWNPDPPPEPRSLESRLRWPRARLGDSWKCVGYERLPGAFRHLPGTQRLETIANSFGPAGAWWLRPRVSGEVPLLTGRRVVSAEEAGDGDEGAGGVRLTVAASSGAREVIVADRVLAATGYRPSLTRLAFLGPDLVSSIRREPSTDTPKLSAHFECSLPGLFFTGVIAGYEFGPTMRFVLGADFASRRVTSAISRRQRKGGATPTKRDYGTDDGGTSQSIASSHLRSP